MRFSVELLPEHPIDELIGIVELADELGFHAVYGADEIYHKDVWQVFAAAALTTRRVRLGPGVTHVILKNPALVAQQIATLDEASDGRVEAAFSVGNVAMLEQCGVDWRSCRPIARLREAHHVLRTLLDLGTIDFEGDFYRYSGIFTAAKPMQERVPLLLGAMRGPRSFELAGEIADGAQIACSHTLEALLFAAEHFRAGAERAGRDWQKLDLAATVLGAIAEDAETARKAARVLVAFYLPASPRELIERHDIDYEALRPLLEAFRRGDVSQAVELVTPELVERFSLAGTPDQWVDWIEHDLLPSRFRHLIATLVDPYLVALWTGTAPPIPSLAEQLRLIHDHVMPAFTRDKEAVRTGIPGKEEE